jgi:ABC-type uncharacterized transport system substrate-binding protein
VCRCWLGLTVVLLLTGLANPVAAARIAVLLSARVDEYEEALKGFREATPHQVVAQYNMEGDLERGRKYLAEIESKVKPDLILAVGIWALQVVVSHPPPIPVVYAMVLNPPAIVGTDAKNITGASMNVPVEQSLRLFKQLGPDVKRIGVVFNRARTGYLVKRAETLAREEGLQLVAREISSSKEAVGALESFHDGIDALWIVPDETVLPRRWFSRCSCTPTAGRSPCSGSPSATPRWARCSRCHSVAARTSVGKPASWPRRSSPGRPRPSFPTPRRAS